MGKKELLGCFGLILTKKQPPSENPELNTGDSIMKQTAFFILHPEFEHGAGTAVYWEKAKLTLANRRNTIAQQFSCYF